MNRATLTVAMREIAAALAEGSAVPYLGPGMLTLAGPDCPLPNSPEHLVARLIAKASVPHKIRNNLTAAAQFIENFKHRRTVTAAMAEAFAPTVAPTELHRLLSAVPRLPLMVHAWYDDLAQQAMTVRASWGLVQGVSQAEHFGNWTRFFEASGAAAPAETATWDTLLYEPFGAKTPAANFLVSDSDFVEVLTEIDIQTPIPEPVVRLRRGRHFLFLGCRFATQLDRIFARQIMKRSSAKHWAVLPAKPTKNEARFLIEQNIEPLDLTLLEFTDALRNSAGMSVAPSAPVF
jgi:hypothetical protein